MRLSLADFPVPNDVIPTDPERDPLRGDTLGGCSAPLFEMAKWSMSGADRGEAYTAQLDQPYQVSITIGMPTSAATGVQISTSTSGVSMETTRAYRAPRSL